MVHFVILKAVQANLALTCQHCIFDLSSAAESSFHAVQCDVFERCCEAMCFAAKAGVWSAPPARGGKQAA